MIGRLGEQIVDRPIDLSDPFPPSADYPTIRSNPTRRALFLIAAGWLSLASLWVWRCTWDDSYILFRYARNFANGLGIVFNPGQRVEGYTSLLWVCVLGLSSRIGWHPPLAAKVWGILLNLVALVACYILCQLLATDRAPMHGLALLLTAGNAYFIVTSTAGLETPLFTALLCWGVVACLKGEHGVDGKSQQRWQVGASVLFALLVMTRPDGALTYFLLWLYTAWRFRSRPICLALFTLPFVLIYTPYFLWRWHFYGLLLPNTFYAKGGGTLALLWKGAAQTAKFLTLQTGGGLAAAAVGLAVILFPTAETTVLGLAIISRIIFELWSGGVTPGEYRFLVPALPLIWILMERVLVGSVWAGGMRPRVRYLVSGICTVLMTAQIVAFVYFRRHNVEPVQNGMERAHVGLGKWLASHSAPNAQVAVGDIGAIGFWSGREILDIDGLVDSHISHLPGIFGEKQDSQYILEQNPEFIILRASVCKPDLTHVSFLPDRELFSNPRFQTDYGQVGCWEFWPGYDLVVYKHG